MPKVTYVKEDGKELTVEIAAGTVLFNAFDDAGNELPHGCLAGSCGACRIEIIDHPEGLQEPSPIELDTIKAVKENYEKEHGVGAADQKTVRLSCRSKVQADFKFKKFK